MRTTLALMLGMGAVLAAALWTAQEITPETVATTLNEIGIEADVAGEELAEQAAAVVQGLEERVEPLVEELAERAEPIVEEVLQEVRALESREPLGAPKAEGEAEPPLAPAVEPPAPALERVEPSSAPEVRVAHTREPVPEDLVVETEDFEEATTWDESWEPGVEEQEPAPLADAAPAVVPDEDPDASAARIRRMLSVYRRTVETRR
ncbi:MAG: hypothetical protein QNK05_13655 [Myxococcota bacterium]|nr:hypothetical protein [Myxococcota bacterium]